MPIDALAFEEHFLDHLSPIWRALRPELRGDFLVDVSLEDRARRKGIEPTLVDGRVIRARGPRVPLPDPGPGPVALVASYGDIKVGRRLGYRRFLFLEHGAGQSYGGDRRNGAHGSYAGGEDRDDVPLFLVPNRHSGDRWKAAYPAAEVRVVGCPKLETLPARVPGPGPVVAISFHWDSHQIPELRSAFGEYQHVLKDLPRRFSVIGHGHPRADWLPRAYRRAGIEFVPDFEDVCRRADVYVCDNSSTLFEFAASERPVVVMNASYYRRNVEHGLRFWSAARVGVNVDGPADLIPGIERALMNRRTDVLDRRAALRQVYTYRDGAVRRAVWAVEAWIDGEAAGSLHEGEAAAGAAL